MSLGRRATCAKPLPIRSSSKLKTSPFALKIFTLAVVMSCSASSPAEWPFNNGQALLHSSFTCNLADWQVPQIQCQLYSSPISICTCLKEHNLIYKKNYRKCCFFVCLSDCSLHSDYHLLHCRDVGAVSAINYHLVLYINGAFYGLYTYTENDHKYYLEVGLRSTFQISSPVLSAQTSMMQSLIT